MTDARPPAAVLAVAALLVVAVVPVAAHTNHVEADTQVTDERAVTVEAVFAATPAWLVIRADDGGKPGEPLGWTKVPAEFLTGVEVEIRADSWERGDVWAVLHQPDNDGNFEPEDDERLETFGTPVQDPFTVGRGPPALVLAEEFGPQETDSPTVTVPAVRLPTDGAVVLRTDTGDGPGEPVGRQSLDAGRHENVTVAIDESFYRDQPESFTLWATLANGSGPVTVGDEPVGSRFGVVRQNAPDRTPTEAVVVTAEPTATPSPTPASTATPTSAAGDSPTGGTTDASGPGFGVLAGLVGLVAALGLARRRRGA